MREFSIIGIWKDLPPEIPVDRDKDDGLACRLLIISISLLVIPDTLNKPTILLSVSKTTRRLILIITYEITTFWRNAGAIGKICNGWRLWL